MSSTLANDCGRSSQDKRSSVRKQWTSENMEKAMKVVSDGMSITTASRTLEVNCSTKSLLLFLCTFFSQIFGVFSLFNFLFLCEIAEAIPFSFLYSKFFTNSFKKNMIISDVQNKVLTLRRDKIFSGDNSAVCPIIAVFTHSNKIACCHFAFSWIHSNLLERMAEGNPLPVQY